MRSKILFLVFILLFLSLNIFSCSQWRQSSSQLFDVGTSFNVDLGNKHSVKMIWVPEGSFLMGTPAGEAVRHNDEDQHKVKISQGFWLSEFEITQKQWFDFIGTTIHEQQQKQYKHWRLRGVGDNLPMYFISWDESIAFTEKLNHQFAQQLPTGYKFSLPTEAQWEYTAKTFAVDDVPLVDRAWFRENSNKRVHPVGSKLPNKLGIYDLKGNLSEWCYDWYGPYPKQALTIDPVGPSTGELKVVRGGSWFGPAINTKASTRFKDPKQNGYSSLTLRLALRPIN
ncbi:MAG: formylglycine-generating enzyme family protein [Colwellia sp.]|nr:formylglycine-generating enzyme family protein [Colwellia sp.]MCW9082278.1 formylglycine-generating enzyme family protein [Colwellia sp.]